MAPIARTLSPAFAIFDRNKPGTPESRAEDRLRQRSANTAIAGYKFRPAGTTTLTGGLGLDEKQDL